MEYSLATPSIFLNICENFCKVTLFYLAHKDEGCFFAVFYTNIS